MITKPIKVASVNDSIWVVWDKTRNFIESEAIVNQFDRAFDECEDEDEAEDVFEDVMDYIDREVASEDLHFGLHKYTEDLGFWPVGVIDEGEEDEIPEENTNEETAQDEGEEQQVDEKIVHRKGRNQERVGKAEILDGEDQVIAESEYRKE